MGRLQQIEERLSQINKEITARGAEMTADELSKIEAEVDALQAEKRALLEESEKENQRQRILTSVASGNEGVVVRGFTPKEETREMLGTMEYRKAFMNYVLKNEEIPQEFRTAGTTSTDVGAMVPTVLLEKVVSKLEATGMILPLVTRTAFKGGVSIPVSAVKPKATWVAEGATSTKQKLDSKKSAMLTFAYHKLRCAVGVSLEVDNMSLVAFEDLLVKSITEAMVKELEAAIIGGDGAGKPKGIITETPEEGQAITTKNTTGLQYEDIVAVEGALPLAYEANAVWCMTKATFMTFVGMTDKNGQPIARVNYGLDGKPERTLLGRKVECCDYLKTFASATTNDTVAFVFDFKDYVVNTNFVLGMKKYEDNDTDEKVTKAIMLVDGKVVDKGSLVTLKKK